MTRGTFDKVYATIPADGTPITVADLAAATVGKGNRVDFLSTCLVRLSVDGLIAWDEEHAHSHCWENKGKVWRVVEEPKEEAPAMTEERQAQGFTEDDISAIMHECPNTAEAYRTDRMVLRAMERIIGKEALGDARMYRAGTGPEAGTLGANPLHGVYYRMTAADYAFSIAYVHSGENGRAWRTIVRALVDVPDWARAGEVIEIMDRYAGDWEDAITNIKAMYLTGVEGVTLTGADVAVLLAGDDDWKLVDEGGLETVLECKRCGGRERFQTAEEAYAFANGEMGEHLHVANQVPLPAGDVADDGAVVAVHAGSQGGDGAGAAERYTVKVKGAAPEPYAIDGGAFEMFAALRETAQAVSAAEHTIAYVRDNVYNGAVIVYEDGAQVACSSWYGKGVERMRPNA